MLNIVNLALAITTSFAMATALSFVAYNYWQDSQIEKKLKSSAAEFENAKISIEKDHVQAIEALDKFDKKLEESEKQIVEAVNEFNKKRKEKLSEAAHKTKKSEPPKFIKPDLPSPIQQGQKVKDSSSEISYDESDNNSSILNENIKSTNQKSKQNTGNIPKKPAKHNSQFLNSNSIKSGPCSERKTPHCSLTIKERMIHEKSNDASDYNDSIFEEEEIEDYQSYSGSEKESRDGEQSLNDSRKNQPTLISSAPVQLTLKNLSGNDEEEESTQKKLNANLSPTQKSSKSENQAQAKNNTNDVSKLLSNQLNNLSDKSNNKDKNAQKPRGNLTDNQVIITNGDQQSLMMQDERNESNKSEDDYETSDLKKLNQSNDEEESQLEQQQPNGSKKNTAVQAEFSAFNGNNEEEEYREGNFDIINSLIESNGEEESEIQVAYINDDQNEEEEFDDEELNAYLGQNKKFGEFGN